MSMEILKAQWKETVALHGEQSKEAATCLYQIGLYAMNNGDFMEATNALGDALYIRRLYYKEEAAEIWEVLYALQQTTVM